MNMELFVQNETDKLEAVVLGIGVDKGVARDINPMIRRHVRNNTYPTEKNICKEIKTFKNVLEQNDVQVLHPRNIPEVNQIFTRDIGFVIEDYFFISNMRFPVRAKEIEGIDHLIRQFNTNKIVRIPQDVLIEGGDVIVWNDYIFLGIGDRSNKNGIDFLQKMFPFKTVLGFDLIVDPENADNNILHLDCAFQPIGTDKAILFQDGFSSRPDPILDLFSKENLIEVDLAEKNKMFPNVFSISPTKIVIERGFERLKVELLKKDFEVFEVDYSETSKLSGLLRCSTLPLRRTPTIIS